MEGQGINKVDKTKETGTDKVVSLFTRGVNIKTKNFRGLSMKWEEKFLRKDHFDFNVGDEVKVSVKVKEGDKERIQVFEGLVIARKGSGLNETFKVRKISFGVGVERTFLLHSPVVANIKVQKRGNVKRAKLFYLRDKVGKGLKIKEDIDAIDASKEEKQEVAAKSNEAK